VNWRYKHTALALCTLAFTATMVARLVISPLIPQIRAEFGVTNATVGLGLSGMWLAYALAVPLRRARRPLRRAHHRHSGRRRRHRSRLLLIIAVSPSILAFIVFAVVLGAGAGLHYSVATTFLAKQFDNIGRAIGVHVAGGPIAGSPPAPALRALVGSRYGWRAGIALGVAVAVPVFALFAWRVRPTEPLRPDQPVRERFALGPLAELLSRPEILYTTALSTMGAFTWQATASFLPSFLEFGTSCPPEFRRCCSRCTSLVHGATQPVTGSMSDRIGRDATVMATMAAGVVGYGLLVAAAEFDFGRPITVVGVGFVGLAMSWGAPLQSRFMDLLSDAERGAGFGSSGPPTWSSARREASSSARSPTPPAGRSRSGCSLA